MILQQGSLFDKKTPFWMLVNIGPYQLIWHLTDFKKHIHVLLGQQFLLLRSRSSYFLLLLLLWLLNIPASCFAIH